MIGKDRMRYHIGEILQFAIRIEENGKKCYQLLAEKFADSPKLNRFFRDLADQEGDHGNYFTYLANKVEDITGITAIDADHLGYLRAFADDLIFQEQHLEAEVAQLKDLEGALAFARRREMDSVNYYMGLKQLLPQEEQTHLDEIIEEERRHYQQLHTGPGANL